MSTTDIIQSTNVRSSILVVDDEVDFTSIIASILKTENFDAETAPDGAEAINALQKRPFDLVLLDVQMPRVDGVEVLQYIKDTTPDTEVVMLSGVREVSIAVDCMQRGAFSYLSKPIEKKELLAVLRGALDRRQLAVQNKFLQRKFLEIPADPDIIGESPAMQGLLALAEKVAPTDSPVLIQGASGTGKELFAKLVFEKSLRSKAPFIGINCAAIPETLIESELFGHAKGAFTDAKETKTGLFDLAHKGTLFLDEIGEVALATQPKLLRFLQFGEYRRVGGKELLHADVRVISATNRDLQKEVREGRFREDLLYRINVITLDIPPLRERKADLPRLVHHIIHRYGKEKTSGGIEDAAMELLRAHEWPGNIRELENVVQRALILADQGTIKPRHISIPGHHVDTHAAESTGDVLGQALPLEHIEKVHIERVLGSVGWNKKLAAKILGISLKTLYTKIAKYQLRDEGRAESGFPQNR